MRRFATIFAALLLLVSCKRETPPPATQAASPPATAPATKPTEVTYVDIIRASYPKMPATQPLAIPVDLRDAGHYIISQPVYLCPRGDLWITHAEARPLAEVLAKAPDEQLHVVRERIRYVHWGVDEKDKPLARVVVEQPDGKLAWIDRDRVTPLLQKGYRFDRVVYFGPNIAVGSPRGVSVFGFSPEIKETYQEIGDAPEILLAPRGVIAWSPTGEGAWRYADDKWTNLEADASWKQKFVHLVPLLDGSVLQITRKDAGKIGVALASLEAPTLDETVINQLIEQLSDDDPEKRDAAYNELQRYGPASWPILEKQLDNQGPEAQIRMRQLLENRIKPTLGGRTLVDGVASVATRFEDGGVLLFAPAGVSTPREDKPPEIIKPAWVSIRPGRTIELLEPVLAKDADPKKQRVFAFENEWIISDPIRGPRRLFGNHLEPMLSKDESAWTHVIGFDRRGRWLFRKSSTTKPAPASTKAADDKNGDVASLKLATSPFLSPTLILDPTLPDTTPRLPVWLIAIEKGQSGWTSDNWPAIKRGGAWALHENGWVPVDEKKAPLITKLPHAVVTEVVRDLPQPPMRLNRGELRPRTTMPATTMATTQVTAVAVPATTRAATTTISIAKLPATAPDQPILIDAEGRKYFDGKQTIRIIDKDGRETVWQLPAEAASNSSFPTVLIQTEDGRLFLFNERGRVVRIKPTPGASEPFVIEAIFTHQIPTSDDIRRIWLDPAGRIVIAYDAGRLAILFPQGRIPQAIANLMLAGDEQQRP